MKAQDLMSQDNNRAEAIRKLQALCDANGYGYAYTEKKFTVELPALEPLPISNVGLKSRPSVDTSNWGPPGPIEGEDEQLPPIDPLSEGKPPKESK